MLRVLCQRLFRENKFPPVHAMIFAAGLGTRLRPLTDERPKPVVPVANLPLAFRAAEHLLNFGATRIAFNTHHLAEVARAELEPLVSSRADVRFFHEEKLLGTGGGLRNAADYLSGGGGVCVMNGDILFEPNLEALYAMHEASGAYATMVLRPHAEAFRFGAIEIDASNRVVHMLRAQNDDPATRAFMFSGVHILSEAALFDLPREGCIIRQGYKAWLARGERVMSVIDESPWRDLGTPAEYLAGNLDFANASPTHNIVHASARIGEGVTLDQSVVGANSLVAPNVCLSRVVVWDGAEVNESLQNAIVTPRTIVRVS